MAVREPNRIRGFLFGMIPTALMFSLSVVFLGSLPIQCLAAQPMDLSFFEAYQMALESNHDIRSAAEGVKQGDLLQRQAITVLFPKLTATAGYSRLEYTDGTGIDGSTWGINLKQTVYNGGRVWVAKRGARYTLQAAQWGLEFARQSVLMDLILRSNELLKAEDLLKVSEKRVERVQEQLRQAQARLDLGDTARTSVLNAQAAMSSVQLGIVQARKSVALARTRLSNLIGVDRPVRVQVPGLVKSYDKMSLSDLITQALDDRPDLAQSRELVKISGEEAEFTRRNGHPDVDITGSYTRYSNDDVFSPESQIGINLTWPFFQGGLVRLQAKEAYSKVRQAEEAYGTQVDGVRLDVEESMLQIEALNAQEELVVNNLKTAMENHRLAKARFNLGAASSLELLDAEEKLTEAENLEVNYKYDTRTAQAALMYSIGVLDLSAFGTGN